MSLSEKHEEIERLASAFEAEAGNFHDIEFSVFYISQEGPSTYRKFRSPNHGIMLWQYYGSLGRDDLVEEFAKNLNDSDLKFGIRGAQLTQCGLIEGDACKLFVRMASRAGSLFDEDEARLFKTRVVSEIREREQEKKTAGKLTVVANDHPAAIWLHYLLYHLSLTNPGRERAGRIEPDPFSLSLLALERLASDKTIGKSDRSSKNVADLAFRVAVSFPGQKRRYVSRVVDALRKRLGNDAVFYDFDYQAQLARPNADVVVQNIYHKQSELVGKRGESKGTGVFFKNPFVNRDVSVPLQGDKHSISRYKVIR